MRHARTTWTKVRALLGAALLASLTSTASAQVVPPSEVDDPWSWAQDAYRQGYYVEGVPYAIEAIQRDPSVPHYYVGLARLYVRSGDYESAVFYYDLYIGELAPTLAEPIPDRYRPTVVAEERQAVNAYREDPNALAVAPSSQEAIRTSLMQRLETGPILTATGGGALADYQTLLRAGYARPDLTEIRARLAQELFNESEVEMDPRGVMIPPLPSQAWQRRAERFERAQALLTVIAPPAELTTTDTPTVDPVAPDAESAVVAPVVPELPARPIENIEAQLAFCDAQLHFLNLNYEAAARSFEVAIAADAEFTPAYMGHLNSLYAIAHQAGTGSPEAAASLVALERLLSDRPDQVGLLAIYTAAFESLAGQQTQAVATIGELLGIPASTP